MNFGQIFPIYYNSSVLQITRLKCPFFADHHEKRTHFFVGPMMVI